MLTNIYFIVENVKKDIEIEEKEKKEELKFIYLNVLKILLLS